MSEAKGGRTHELSFGHCGSKRSNGFHQVYQTSKGFLLTTKILMKLGMKPDTETPHIYVRCAYCGQLFCETHKERIGK